MNIELSRLAAKAISPMSWRTRTRRLFALSLPFSLLLWLALLAILVMGLIVLDVGRPIANFLNSPPKRRRRRSYGGENMPAPTAMIFRLPLPTRSAYPADVKWAA